MRFRAPIVALLTASLLGLPGHASESALSEQRFDVSIRDQNVRSVFDELSAAIGVPILVSDAVQGRVDADFEAASATELLNGIADRRGLDWRFDGQRVRVTAQSEQATRIVDLDGIKLKELTSSLKSLNVYNSRFQVTAVDGKFAMIVAPPDYIALVEVVLGAMIESEADERAVRERAEKDRREFEREAQRQRLEFERIERAAELDRARVEQQQLLQQRREQELRSRRGPQIIRNGVWGG